MDHLTVCYDLDHTSAPCVFSMTAWKKSSYTFMKGVALYTHIQFQARIDFTLCQHGPFCLTCCIAIWSPGTFTSAGIIGHGGRSSLHLKSLQACGFKCILVSCIFMCVLLSFSLNAAAFGHKNKCTKKPKCLKHAQK